MLLLVKLAVLVAALIAIGALNWKVNKVFFLFRNDCQSYLFILLYGFAGILLTLVGPFIAMCYLSAWVFASMPDHPVIYFIASQLSWMVAALIIALRSSAKYWTNRS